MRIVFYLLLMLAVGRCTKNNNFETKTVGVGGYVELTCPRKSSESLFWIRIDSGDFPEVLGKTFSPKSNDRITATEERELFVLHIQEAKLSDAAVYYCIQISQQFLRFLTQTDLRVKEPESTAVSPTDPVRPGGSVTLQCSILSDSGNKTRPEEQHLCCFKAFNQSLNNTRGNVVEVHEKEPGGPSKKKCVYSLYKTCDCDVATCEDIISGNRSELNTTDFMLNQQKNNTIISLLGAALAICVIVNASLIYAIKKLKGKSCGVCNTAVTLHTNETTAGKNQRGQQTDDDSLIYSAPTFIRRISSKGTGGAKAMKEECIYTDARALGLA
ncbi:uncharacterized protein LOC117491552 [Trematomus bernacchii]|uniref:uncharacterized protein LOC117491552 n=1 Tax=Trematomus bernacchii TaxID=40690 RepID=UPI00146B38B6|nr:uncharacterized protein LOC117491552 [Trematomus bernacchii]